MARRARVDAELVRRGLARSRQQAAELIGAGRVSIDGMPAAKPATADRGQRRAHGRKHRRTRLGLARCPQTDRCAGRFRIRRRRPPVPGRRSLDRRVHRGPARSRRRARSSPSTSDTASWRGRCATIRASPCVERTNVRDLTPDAIGGPVDLVVADLSFISLSTVLPALTSCAVADADIVPMVKPQFEVGKDRVGAGGVVVRPAVARRSGARRRPPRRRTAVAHGRRHRQPAARSVRQRRVLPAAAVANRQPAARGVARPGRAPRRRGGPAMSSERDILLVVHTGRDDATEVGAPRP